jgi:hypothetical protein
MGDQTSFASMAWSRKGKVTRRERFLAEMDAVIPWPQVITLVEPHYPREGSPGRPAHDLERMLRIYFLQQWFNLSDPQAEDAIYDSESMRRFAKVELSFDKVPDETTILRFRHLLEKHRLTQKIFEAVKDLLEERRLFLHSGTIVDAMWRVKQDENRATIRMRTGDRWLRVVETVQDSIVSSSRTSASSGMRVAVFLGVARVAGLPGPRRVARAARRR